MGQISIDTCSHFFFDEFANSDINIKSYIITNNTKEDYVTWVSSDYIDSNSNEEAIRRYFNKQIGDFSLSSLLYENLLNSSLTNRIGSTFMKRIKPKETFQYLIIKKNRYSDYYEKRLFIVSRKKIEDYLRKALPEECFSLLNILPLYEDDLTGDGQIVSDSLCQKTSIVVDVENVELHFNTKILSEFLSEHQCSEKERIALSNVCKSGQTYKRSWDDINLCKFTLIEDLDIYDLLIKAIPILLKHKKIVLYDKESGKSFNKYKFSEKVKTIADEGFVYYTIRYGKKAKIVF